MVCVNPEIDPNLSKKKGNDKPQNNITRSPPCRLDSAPTLTLHTPPTCCSSVTSDHSLHSESEAGL